MSDTKNTTTNTITTEEIIQTTSLADDKAIMLEEIIPVDHSSDDTSLSHSLSKLRLGVYESFVVSLLIYETHLQHLLAMSISYTLRKTVTGFLKYNSIFSDTVRTIRKIVYDSFDFSNSNHNFPVDIMMPVITIVNDVNCGLLTKLE